MDTYNSRDKLVFVNEVVEDFVNALTKKLIQLWKQMEDDKKSFAQLGITYEEKVFFDILISVRDAHKFPYAEEKCLELSKEIKKLLQIN